MLWYSPCSSFISQYCCSSQPMVYELVFLFWHTDTNACFILFSPLFAFIPSFSYFSFSSLIILSTSPSSHSSIYLFPSSFHLVFFTFLHLLSSLHPSVPLLSFPPPPRWELPELHWSRPSVGERWVMTVIRNCCRARPVCRPHRRTWKYDTHSHPRSHTVSHLLWLIQRHFHQRKGDSCHCLIQSFWGGNQIILVLRPQET